MAKQQFNVNLEAGLVRRVKHASIDAQLSLSDLVAAVLSTHLDAQETPMANPNPIPHVSPSPGDGGPLVLQPMVHVEDMTQSVTFYEALGATVINGSRDGDFALIQIGTAQLSLLAHPANPEQDEGIVELNFESREPLEQLEERLRTAGVTIAQPTTDEGFGRQLQLLTPDGLLIKVNELDSDLYG